MTELPSTRTLAEVASALRCGAKKVADVAREHGIGMNLKGSAGWRFTDADVAGLYEAMRPKPLAPMPRRRRRR